MISSQKFDKAYFNSGVYKNYGQILSEWVSPMARRAARLFRGQKSPKVLDIGCGFGNFIAELQDKHNFCVQGLDCSHWAVQNSCLSVKDKIVQGSILKLPFGRNSFDLVTCFDVIYYLTEKEIEVAIKNIVNVSKEYIFLNTIFKNSIDASQKHNPDPLRMVVLTKKQYINLFNKYGARFVKGFHEENGGETLIFKK